MVEGLEGDRHYQADVEYWQKPENIAVLNKAKDDLEKRTGLQVVTAPNGVLYITKDDLTYHLSVGSNGELSRERVLDKEGNQRNIQPEDWSENFFI